MIITIITNGKKKRDTLEHNLHLHKYHIGCLLNDTHGDWWAAAVVRTTVHCAIDPFRSA